MKKAVPNDKKLEMTILMTPDMVNFSGKVHGGAILKILDQVAYACASRYSGHYVVTLAADQVLFRQPIHVGELVTFLAQINYTGTSSMEVGIKVIAENPRTQVRHHVLSSYFTMVALNEKSETVAVPPLKLRSQKDKDRFAAALKRKKQRQKALSS